MADAKGRLEDKRDSLRDKCDMLDALSADMLDIGSAIKAILPQKTPTLMSDMKTVEENKKYEEVLVL